MVFHPTLTVGSFITDNMLKDYANELLKDGHVFPITDELKERIKGVMLQSKERVARAIVHDLTEKVHDWVDTPDFEKMLKLQINLYLGSKGLTSTLKETAQ